MTDRREFEMTEAQREKILAASQPVPAMCLSGGQPMFGTPQENANRAWRELGLELGFDYMSVRPVGGKSDHFFSAVPTKKAWQKPEVRRLEPGGGR